jgi:uncharacterized membrane protein YeaQ/YmgE (transglycosylase-associated protein family)
MHFLGTLIIGLIVGAIAKFLMPGKDPGGIIITMLIGIAGALIAGFLGRALGWYVPGETAGFNRIRYWSDSPAHYLSGRHERTSRYLRTER